MTPGVDPTDLRAATGDNGGMVTQSTYGPVARRFIQAGAAFALLGLTIPGFVFMLASLISAPLVLVSVGIPLAIGTVWLGRGIARAQRALFRNLFGVRIDNPYRSWPRGHIGVQLLALVKDVTVWRDIAWQAVNSSLGLLVYIASIALLFVGPFYLVYPLLWSVWPNVFNEVFGFIPVETFGAALWLWPVAALFVALWWWLSDLLLGSYARLATVLLRPTKSSKLEQRVEQLMESRADTVDSSAAELRRIERDLHDGAQARLVALGMSLGMAEELIDIDPKAAARLLAEARENSGQALTELRDLVRGIHPPVLADRGLVGAVEALALDHPLPVTVVAELPGRLPEPVESAAYFAVAEVLTNVAKYARATRVRVLIGHFGHASASIDTDEAPGPRLGIVVRDDGVGGARVLPGGGLAGVQRRLASFDGEITVQSPKGGPTVITLEIPCEPLGQVTGGGTA